MEKAPLTQSGKIDEMGAVLATEIIMDTTKVNICYRPLRIAWAIHSSDISAFRQAVRLSHVMWGGRFNPIVMVDQPNAKQLIDLFRVDVIVALGDLEEVKNFPKKFPYLISPFFPDELFLKGIKKGDTLIHVLDIHNALIHWGGTPEWKQLTEQGIRYFNWEADDPLADVFLTQYGVYPDTEETGINYLEILSQATTLSVGLPVISIEISKNASVPQTVLEHPNIAGLTRYGLRRHYSTRIGADYPGFFIGDASSIDDLVCFWNLRAADISVYFFDPKHITRYEVIRPLIEARFQASISHLDEHRSKPAIWSRINVDKLKDYCSIFGEGLILNSISEHSWNGFNIKPPLMIFGEETALGILGVDQQGIPKVSFALTNKPFCGDSWFYKQHLVASISLKIYGNEYYTFRPPYLPELNESLARSMYFIYNELRIEPERIGIIIDAAKHDISLNALPIANLVTQIFDMLGVTSKPSNSGLIARQIIARLGGIEGARVFKIPGVRRLLKQYGPTQAFAKKTAIQLIGGKDPDNPEVSFKDHLNLFIEPRPLNEKLTPIMVFGYLVEKGLFRIGAELLCPICSLKSWIALDALKQTNICQLCGNPFDATRQLAEGECYYRRSGVLGLEKNSQGAIPVALLLQQLMNNLHGTSHDTMYVTSYDLKPETGSTLPECEIDFMLIFPDFSIRSQKAQIIIGECKDKYKGDAINQKDIENLRQIADAFPSHRFDVFIAFAKLSPFTPEEIELARSLNNKYQQRVILLTDRELEPYHLYERTEQDLNIEAHSSSPKDLAMTTAQIYFSGNTAITEQ